MAVPSRNRQNLLEAIEAISNVAYAVEQMVTNYPSHTVINIHARSILKEVRNAQKYLRAIQGV